MMNRPKQGKGRPPNQPPEDLIALGRSKTQPTTMKQPLKRDFSEAINTLDNDPNKRQKLDNAPVDENMQSGSETVAQIMKCDEEGDYRQIRQIVEMSMRKLQNTPLNPDPNIYLSLIYSAKVKPKIFANSIVWDVLASFLKSSTEFHYKKTPLVPVLACNLLLKAFAEVDEWPLEFVQAYLEDSFGDRLWVDDKHTQVFVDNIKTMFPSQKGNTAAPSKSRDPVSHDESENDEDVKMNEAEEAGEIVLETERKPVNMTLVKNRFSEQYKEAFRSKIIEMITMQLNRADANVKNIVAVMLLVISYPSVRLIGANYLDNWLNNPTTTRYGKELLERIIENCTQSTVEDLEALRLIVRIKIKANTSVNQFYFEKLTKLLGNNPHFPFIALSDFIANEMAPGITKFNPKMLTTIFTAIPIDQRERQVSLIVQELAGNKIYNTLLRPVLKAISKNFPNQFRFDLVCSALMQEFTPVKMRDDFVREQWVMNVMDLICYSMLLSVPTVLYESPQNLGPREFDALAIDAKKRIAALQLEAITWSQTVLLELIKQPTQHYFAKVIRKLLLLEPATSYISGDMAPEYERLLMSLVQSDVPVLEETIISVVVMHLKSMPLAQNEALVIIDQLILRAISMVNSSEGVNPIQLANPQFSEALFRLAMFTHTIMEQLGEEGKTKYSFAIRDLFWQVCIILVICAAFNPATIGRTVWQSYPTIKVLIEMITTRSWKFPPFQFSDCPSPADEQKFLTNEGEQILSFENELLGFFKSPSEVTKIDAENSVMMKQLMMYSPLQPARRPPPNIIERLQTIEKEFHIGHLLCSSRDPDFLVDIMKRQGPKDSLGWLGPIVKKEEHTLDILPTQCLCYLLYSTQQPEHEIDYTTVPMEKLPHMLTIIRSHFSAASGAPTIEILEFFISRLGDSSRVKRDMAQKSLALIFSGIHYNAKTPEQHSTNSQMEEDFEEEVIESSGAIDTNNLSTNNGTAQSPLPNTPMSLSGAPATAKLDWLNKLDMLQWFKLSKEIVCDLLLAALVQETEIETIFNYLLFIYEHKDGEHLSMAMEISGLIRSRRLAVSRMFHDSTVYSLFLKILYDGFNFIKTSDKQEVRSDASTADVVLKGKKLTLKKTMIEAILELLIFDFNCCDVSVDSETKELLEGVVDDMTAILSERSNNTYQPEPALMMRVARSPHEILAVPVLSFLSKEDLIVLIGSYGLNFDVAKAILNRLDKSDLLETSASDPSYVKKLTEILEMNGISTDQFVEIVMIYNSMDIIGSDKLLKLFGSNNSNASEMDTEVEFDFNAQQDFMQLKESKFVSIDAELNSRPADERTTWLLSKAFSGTDPALGSLAYQRLLNMVEIDLVVAQSQGQTMQILKSIQNIFARVSVGNMEHKVAVELVQDSWRSLPLFELLYRSVKQSQKNESLHQFIVTATKIIDFSKTFAENLPKNSLIDSLNGIVSANHVQHSQQDLQFIEFDFDKYIASKSPAFDVEIVRDLKAHKKIAGFANFDAQKFGTLVFKLIETRSANLENILQLSLKPFIEQQSQHNASRMDSVTRVLIGLIRDLSSHYFHNQQKSTILNKEIGQRYFGCLFDWILIFNPDLVHEELFNLIFRKSRDMTAIGLASISQPPFYSLMLSVLIHRTSWAAKRQIFTWLMARDRPCEELNPSTTLDYIEAYLYHPQSWTGFTNDNEVLFEYKITTQTVPSLHKFSSSELITLTDLIVIETEVLQRRAVKNNDIEEKNRASTTLQKRASLLVSCANQTEGHVQFVLNYLSNKPEINISQLYRVAELLDEPLDSANNEISTTTLFGFPSAAERLLQAIYIASPVSLYKVLKRDIYLPLKSALLKANTSELDVLMHRIIKKISPNEPASNFAYLTCRKVAAEHHSLVFKYLPNLGSLLEGTSALPLDQYLEKKYHVLYERILGVFDLLRPMIFEFDGVQPILHHFFDLFGNIELKEESQFKQLASLLRALVDFMCHYAAHLEFSENESAALQNRIEWVKLRKGVLMAVFKSYPDLTKIEFFANILDHKVSQEEFNSPFVESDAFKQLKMDLMNYNHSRKSPTNNSGEDQMEVDQSNDIDCLIEELGKYPPNLLASVILEVTTLMEHSSDLVRQAAYKFVIKYLHDNPRAAADIIDDHYVNMISRNKAEDIQLSALIHAPSLFPFANEQDVFLDALFKLGNVASSDIKNIVHEVTQFLY